LSSGSKRRKEEKGESSRKDSENNQSKVEHYGLKEKLLSGARGTKIVGMIKITMAPTRRQTGVFANIGAFRIIAGLHLVESRSCGGNVWQDGFDQRIPVTERFLREEA